MFTKTFLYAVTLAVALNLAGCGGKQQAAPVPEVKTVPKAEVVVGVGRVEPEDKIFKISAEVGGVIRRIAVKSGDKVRRGDVILELTDEIETAAVTQNAAAVQTKEAEIGALQASIEANQIKIKNAEVKVGRIKNLVAKQAETKQVLDDAETELLGFKKEIDRLNAQIAAARVAAAEARTKVAAAQTTLSKRVVRAPADGEILTMDLTPGASVAALATVAEMAPVGSLSVLTEIDELFSEKTRLDQQATVRLQGTTETVATGTVVYVAPSMKKKSLFSETAGDLEDRRVREVRVRLAEGSNLAIGSRVECVISLK